MSTFDMTESIAPKSDQLNADDLISGERTFTITEVRRGTAEQPFDFHLAEFPGRPYKPSKSMRRVMVLAWGGDASKYVGRRLTLYREPTVRWAGQEIGGIRISHMSDLKKPLQIALTESKSKRTPFVVKPLPAEAAPAASEPTTDVTSQQLADIGAGLKALGITDREAMLATVAQVIDREISSAADLTKDEAIGVLSWIQAEQANAPTLPEASA